MTSPGNRRYLEVECWCRTNIVSVPVRDVMAVLTRPCGMERCKTLDRQARAEREKRDN